MGAIHASLAVNGPVALVAARMTSVRLPGKALLPLGNNVLLGYVVNALAAARNVGTVVVVTSTEVADDPIVHWCDTCSVPVWRGPLDDVAARMLDAAQDIGADAFIRISGDSPLLDPRIVEVAVKSFLEHSYDVVTNVYPRTFPPGQSVEVVRVRTLRRLLNGPDATEFDREHVTPILYRHADALRIGHLSIEQVGGDVDGLPPYPSLTVDTPGDVQRVQAALELLNGVEPWEAGWQRCVSIMRGVDEAVRARTRHGEG